MVFVLFVQFFWVYTILFISPIFPYITDYKKIVELSKEYIDEYWFENLNLRGSYKQDIISYIKRTSPHLLKLYNELYIDGNMEFWNSLSVEIEEYCNVHSIKHVNYFYHKKLVEAKLKQK